MLRHCTIEELLAIRDGEGTAAARDHVAQCESCRSEMESLHRRRAALKALPSIVPPRDRWPIVRDQVMAARRRTRWYWGGWSALAAAATIVLVVGLTGFPPTKTTPAAGQELESLMQESQDLESLLQSYNDQGGRVVDGMTAAVIADIEDRIAAVDWTIQQARQASVTTDQMTDLWRRRVALMDQLVSTHVQQVRYVGY
jgi:hypothetical protein